MSYGFYYSFFKNTLTGLKPSRIRQIDKNETYVHLPCGCDLERKTMRQSQHCPQRNFPDWTPCCVRAPLSCLWMQSDEEVLVWPLLEDPTCDLKNIKRNMQISMNWVENKCPILKTSAFFILSWYNFRRFCYSAYSTSF